MRSYLDLFKSRTQEGKPRFLFPSVALCFCRQLGGEAIFGSRARQGGPLRAGSLCLRGSGCCCSCLRPRAAPIPEIYSFLVRAARFKVRERHRLPTSQKQDRRSWFVGVRGECGLSADGEARSGSVPGFLKRESAGGFGLTLRLRGGATSPKLVPTQKGTGSVGADPRGAPRGGESYRGRGDHIEERGLHRGSGDHIGRWGIVSGA